MPEKVQCAHKSLHVALMTECLVQLFECNRTRGRSYTADVGICFKQRECYSFVYACLRALIAKQLLLRSILLDATPHFLASCVCDPLLNIAHHYPGDVLGFLEAKLALPGVSAHGPSISNWEHTWVS